MSRYVRYFIEQIQYGEQPSRALLWTEFGGHFKWRLLEPWNIILATFIMIIRESGKTYAGETTDRGL